MKKWYRRTRVGNFTTKLLFSYIYGMLYCSSECGSFPIMLLRTIYCNTHVCTFHVCLCLLALTFVCNSTYLLKLEVQNSSFKQHTWCFLPSSHRFRTFSNFTQGDRIPMQFLQAFCYIIYNKKQYRYAHFVH